MSTTTTTLAEVWVLSDSYADMCENGELDDES